VGKGLHNQEITSTEAIAVYSTIEDLTVSLLKDRKAGGVLYRNVGDLSGKVQSFTSLR